MRFNATLAGVFVLSMASALLFVGPDAFENHTPVARTVIGALVGIFAVAVAVAAWRVFLRWPPDAETRAKFPPGQLRMARIGGVILTVFALLRLFIGITLVMGRLGR
jgi:uncharacterized membrane protein YidH (DUF202 family)